MLGNTLGLILSAAVVKPCQFSTWMKVGNGTINQSQHLLLKKLPDMRPHKTKQPAKGGLSECDKVYFTISHVLGWKFSKVAHTISRGRCSASITCLSHFNITLWSSTWFFLILLNYCIAAALHVVMYMMVWAMGCSGHGKVRWKHSMFHQQQQLQLLCPVWWRFNVMHTTWLWLEILLE